MWPPSLRVREKRSGFQEKRDGAGGGEGVGAGDFSAAVDAAGDVEICAGDGDGLVFAVGVDEEFASDIECSRHEDFAGVADAPSDCGEAARRVECGVDAVAEEEGVGGVLVVPAADDVAAIVDSIWEGIDGAWDAERGEGAFVPEEADEGAVGVVLYLVVADDVACIVDGGGSGGECAGVVEQGVLAAIEKESVDDGDGFIGEGANDDSLVIDAGRGDAEGVRYVDVGDFAAAQEKAVGVELVVVPIADGFALVVDAEGIGDRGTWDVDGGDAVGVSGCLGRCALVGESRGGKVRMFALARGRCEERDRKDRCQGKQRDGSGSGEAGKLFHARIVPRGF